MTSQNHWRAVMSTISLPLPPSRPAEVPASVPERQREDDREDHERHDAADTTTMRAPGSVVATGAPGSPPRRRSTSTSTMTFAQTTAAIVSCFGPLFDRDRPRVFDHAR